MQYTAHLLRLAACAGLVLFISACSSTDLVKARQQFYTGQYERALETLEDEDASGRNRTLFHMERGMVRQQKGDYEGSIEDWLRASERIEALETYSLSKGGASMLANDEVQDFRGLPFERTLVHAFAGMSFMALGQFDSAAVEARRIIASLDKERRGKYPDDAFSRYYAGFALEMIDDYSNAAIEYRAADELLPNLIVDPETGRIGSTNAPPVKPLLGAGRGRELICFVLLGRAPSGAESIGAYTFDPLNLPHVVIEAKGQPLGRSYPLSSTTYLTRETERAAAGLTLAKTGSRIAIKEGLAQVVAHNSNDATGDLVRFILIGLLEKPDYRRWETLPRTLQIARVPLPDDAESFDVIFKNHAGLQTSARRTLTPQARRRDTYVAIIRDMPDPESP